MIFRMMAQAKTTTNTVGGHNALVPPAALLHCTTVQAGLHACVLDTLGLAICAGDIETGSVARIEQLQGRYGVSRSLIHEVIRVLAAMGLVTSRRRVGVQVLSATAWNLNAPEVIAWRMASPGRVAQLQSLTELRTAIEPEAARQAALQGTPADAGVTCARRHFSNVMPHTSLVRRTRDSRAGSATLSQAASASPMKNRLNVVIAR